MKTNFRSFWEWPFYTGFTVIFLWASTQDLGTYRICPNGSISSPADLTIFMFSSSEGSGETVYMHRFIWVLAVCQHNKYHSPICWLISNCYKLVSQPLRAVGNVPDCRSRGRQFDPGLVSCFHGNWSWNNFYGHSPAFSDLRRVVVSYKGKHTQEVLVNHLVKLAQEKSVVRCADCPNMTIAVDWDVKHEIKQTINWLANKILVLISFAQMGLINAHADLSGMG